MNFLSEEKKWRKRGYKRVACLDEAGRGPLAGPVTAAAVLLKINSNNPELLKISKNIKDSKKLSAKKRQEFFKILTRHPGIKWGVGIVSEKVIDRINILQATKLAMAKAIKNLKVKPDFLILDGNFKINSLVPQKPIIKADNKVFSCIAASIIAKVTRDRIMIKYDEKYPCYKFKIHKGYPTKLHLRMLKRYGPCRIHRRTFRPVRRLAFKNK
ncbi:MAG: ribonuclease HII [Candidatus Pacebacteria bacterium]|nr:ribonuclease HII [Candidatus Paceibacterota bacterium]